MVKWGELERVVAPWERLGQVAEPSVTVTPRGLAGEGPLDAAEGAARPKVDRDLDGLSRLPTPLSLPWPVEQVSDASNPT